jgi:integrase
MALTDVAIRNAKPQAKPYKLGDSGGLFLQITPAGGKLWRVKFRTAGKEKLLSLGAWPDVSLASARKQRDKARELLAAGSDPAREKRKAKALAKVAAANTFGEVGREYLDKRKREGMATRTTEKAEYHLTRFAPNLGRMPISEITAPDVLAVLRVWEKQGKHETAKRLLQLASRIFRYAVATARLTSDPTRDLRGAITTPQVTHFATILEPKRIGELLRAIGGYEGMGITRFALQLAPHVFVRPGELREARWEEIDLNAAVWAIPGEKTKMRKEHRVPLSRQALGILREVHPATGSAGYVFPSVRTSLRPLSEGTINSALRRLGYEKDEMTGHGFRAMASTLLNESGKWSPDAIERALAHRDKDTVRASYHRGSHWEERVAMAQWWSDHLDVLRKGATVLKLPAAVVE